MAGIAVVADLARGGCDEGGGGQQADAGYGEQHLTRALFDQCGQLMLQLGNALFQQPDLFDQQFDRAADQFKLALCGTASSRAMASTPVREPCGGGLAAAAPTAIRQMNGTALGFFPRQPPWLHRINAEPLDDAAID